MPHPKCLALTRVDLFSYFSAKIFVANTARFRIKKSVFYNFSSNFLKSLATLYLTCSSFRRKQEKNASTQMFYPSFSIGLYNYFRAK